MQVQILLFGALKDVLARKAEVLLADTVRMDAMDLPDGATVEDFLRLWMAKVPEMQTFSGSLAVAVNREYASPTHRLHDGDEIALLPPVSGGSVADAPPGKTLSMDSDWVRLQRETIDAEALVAQVKEGEAGAVVVFDGIVRNHTRGRRTLFLDYEAYEPMALNQMHGLVKEAKRRFEIRKVALVHRLGRLQIGETSVLIAVASAHRAQAFEACRWIIDTLKQTVPIWKKEWFEDGAVWADGEPFPAEISGHAFGDKSGNKP